MTRRRMPADAAQVGRAAALAALLACSLVAAAVALAGPPRLEQERLRPADMALARQISLRASDLPPGWVRRAAPRFPEDLPSCPGVDLDFSAFTLTGRAQSKFAKGLAGIDSVVEVFESRADAVGDFRKASNPRVLGCAANELRKHGITVVSARMTGRPRVGERALAYRVVLAGGGERFYMDLLGFQRGRSIVGLYFSDAQPIAGRLAAARSVAARMR